MSNEPSHGWVKQALSHHCHLVTLGDGADYWTHPVSKTKWDPKAGYRNYTFTPEENSTLEESKKNLEKKTERAFFGDFEGELG